AGPGAFHAVRAYIGGGEDALNRGFADAELLRQFSAGPVRGPIFRAVLDCGPHSGLQFWSSDRWFLPGMPLLDQTGRAMLQKAFFPTEDSRSSSRQQRLNLRIRNSLHEQKD